MGEIEARLARMNLSLFPAFKFPKPSRRGCTRVGDIIYLSGHGALGLNVPGLRLHGKLGFDMTTEEGYAVARVVAVKILSTLKQELGDLDRITQIVRLFGMVNSAPDFHHMPAVIDGASDVFYELFGPERGCHARTAIGVATLPHGSAVEINGEFRVEG
jgi:enamine deaminase RidA (YjgF/YER057c/UK114 family)